MTLFNPVFNCLTPKGVKRSKTQADEGLGPQPKAGDASRRSWLCRSASAPSQQACEPVEDRCSGPCSRPRHAAAWRSRNRAPAGWVAWATNAITEGRARFRIGTQWFFRSGCWNRCASSGERAIAVESRIDKLSAPTGRLGSLLVPGQGKPVGREKAENKVYRRGRRQQDGGRKRGAEGLGTAASLLMGTRPRDGGGRQNRGKTGLTTQENECEKGKLRLRENRRTDRSSRRLPSSVDRRPPKPHIEDR